MKEQSSFREQAKFSWRTLCSSRRILRSPMSNEDPDSNGLLCSSWKNLSTTTPNTVIFGNSVVERVRCFKHFF